MSAPDLLPFDDLRVLDLSQGIAGPYCAHILAQQGADVLKVEPPAGDWGRGVGAVRAGHSALSVAYNAGKRAVCVDGKSDEGRAVLRRLAAGCDVVVQNFRPGVAQRLGLGYDALARERPGLVYVSISGYGDDGPFADAPASDSVIQADSGLMAVNRDARGAPQRVGLLLADIACAAYAAQATAAALYKRLRTGRGEHVKINLLQCCAALQNGELIEQLLAGRPREGAVSAPNGVFDTADGRISVLALNDDQFARLCRALARPGWLDDPRFAGNDARMAHRNVLHAELGAELLRDTTAAWAERFARHEVLHAPVRTLAELPAHPQARHLGLFEEVHAAGLPPLPIARLPALGTARALSAPPRVGEHTAAILEEAGYLGHEIERLLGAGVVRQAAAMTAGQEQP